MEQGLPKAIAATRKLAAINSDIETEPAVRDLTPSNIDDLLGDVTLILDGTDNFETRYLINDYAVSHARPWVYGAAVGSYGITMPVVPGTTACLRCIYPDPPGGTQPTCETAGVLGSITALIASLQVSEAFLQRRTFLPRIVTRAPLLERDRGRLGDARRRGGREPPSARRSLPGPAPRHQRA